MSTGKRLAKRSIVGTRVAALGDDGFFYSGVINAVKNPASVYPENNNCINLTPNTRFSVRFDSKSAVGKKSTREYAAQDLVGPGFRSIHGLNVASGQKVYLTFNGREVHGDVRHHDSEADEVHVAIHPSGSEMPVELVKRLDEVRLLESRKSARLADQDTDFARLADMGGDRRKSAHNLDYPPNFNPRKRRPSSSGDSDMKDDVDNVDTMDECNAALVLMSLSCSPHSPQGALCGRSSASPAGSSSGSWRSGTPSPAPGGSPASWPASYSDEGIGLDYHDRDEHPKKKKTDRGHIQYKCTWPGCNTTTKTRGTVEKHIRKAHLSTRENVAPSDGEEEFYYTETDAPPPPTLSHRDMCRPPHEDPDYQRQFVGSYRQGLLLQQGQAAFNFLPTGPIAIPSVIQTPWPNSNSPNTPLKHMKLSGGPSSPVRRPRESKKCRKQYGMNRRDDWCTQCKWKKACTRFGD